MIHRAESAAAVARAIGYAAIKPSQNEQELVSTNIIAAAPALDAPATPRADAVMLLHRKWVAAAHRTLAVAQDGLALGPGLSRETEDNERRMDMCLDRESQLIEDLIASPSYTLAGLLAKISIAAFQISGTASPNGTFDPAERLVLSARDDALRLIGAIDMPVMPQSPAIAAE